MFTRIFLLIWGFIFMCNLSADFRVGWSEVSITPEDRSVLLAGQFYARVSEGIKDPVVATIMAIDSGDAGSVFLISCDLVAISEDLLDAVRAHLRISLPEFPSEGVIMNATHTHTAPNCRVTPRYTKNKTATKPYGGLELDAMSPAEYVAFASERIANAALAAWNSREASGIAYGLGHTVVGRNRLISYYSGRSVMYGATSNSDFSHVEGYEDHSLNLFASYDTNKKLNGMVINIACPTQSYEHGWEISADYWHNIRTMIKERFGVYALAQVSAAGDQSPHSRFLPDNQAEIRMQRLADKNRQEELARRIVDEVARILPLIEKDINWEPDFRHSCENVNLPKRLISQADVDTAIEESKQAKKDYDKNVAELEANPEIKNTPRWYMDLTQNHTRMSRGARVQRRFKEQGEDKNLVVEMHSLRIGEIAMVTNPFELYLDYGMQIKALSPAVQTFVVQLAGPGSYVPTAKSIAGGAYGAVPASTEIGANGGREVVKWSVAALEKFWYSIQEHNVAYLGKDNLVLGKNKDLAKLPMTSCELTLMDGANYPEVKAELQVGWTDNYFVLQMLVEDKKHFNNSHDSGMWNGDAMQILFASTEDEELLSTVQAYLKDGASLWNFLPTRKMPEDAYFDCSRDEKKSLTKYSAIIPLSFLKVKEGGSVKLNTVVFDDKDGRGQQGWLCLTKGLAGGKRTQLYDSFKLKK